MNRLNAILEALQRGLLLAAALLGLGVMVIVGNTIRLDIQNRRDEIEVTKLVGGSDAFVRRPFLYNGFWYGLGGAVTAWISRCRPRHAQGANWPAGGSVRSSYELGALGRRPPGSCS